MSNMQTINGREYSFGIIPAEEAVVIEVAIARVIGEPAFKALMDLGDVKDLKSVSKEKMMAVGAAAVGLLTSKMDPDDLLATMKRVMAYVSVDGARCNINTHFTGRNKDLWVVFIAALQFNFSDFFPASLSGSLPSLVGK